MRLFTNMRINQRIAIVIVLLFVLLYATLSFLVFQISTKRVEQTIEKQAQVYLDKLSALISEIEKQTPKGFNHLDYASLKPYFNQPAYFSTDYPFLIDATGSYNIHLYREGQRYPRERLNALFSDTNRQGRFEYTEIQGDKPQKIAVFYKKIDSYNSFICYPVNLNEAKSNIGVNVFLIVFIIALSSFIFIICLGLVLNPMMNAISKIGISLSRMAVGEPGQKIIYSNNDDVSDIVNSLNGLIDGLNKTAQFASEIGKNNLSSDFTPLGSNDILGNSLLEMRESLKHAAQEEVKRKSEDERRNWINVGLATFSDILRQNNNNLQLLSDNITQNLLNYLNANQGGLFIINEDNENEPQLDLLSAFAFNRKKYLQKSIMLGEGLVGNCALERKTIYLKEIPEDYIQITSGLGDASPRSLLITPLKIEDKVFGVIELATFSEFLPHEIEFVEKIGENIASTLSSVKNSIRTSHLLEQSQQQREEMSAQEEEMRQNMEEMQATQEEMARKTIEMEGMTSAINESLLFGELDYNGSFLNINPNFLNILGYSRMDIEDLTISDLINKKDQFAFRSNWERVISGETFKDTLNWCGKNNEELYILCSISPAFDERGDIFKIFFLGQDVTGSKQIELKAQLQAEELEQNLMELQAEQEIAQEREEEINALLQGLDTTCLVTEFDPDGKILYINSKNEEVLGDKKSDIEGKYHFEIDFEAKTHPEKFKQFWADLLAGIKKHREFTLNVRGKTVWISENYTPFIGKNGQVTKIVNIGLDITKNKETELHLQKQVEELSKKFRNSQ